MISEDSDNLPYGVPKVLLKLDAAGKAQEIVLADLFREPQGDKGDIVMRDWSHDMFLLACIVAGCDYYVGIYNVGFKTACRVLFRLGRAAPRGNVSARVEALCL